jgi:deoxyribodipyrimidine photo-lyase
MISFPDVYTQFRVALEKQGIRVRSLINIPNTFKPLPDGIVIKSVPNLSDFGYSSMKYVDLLKFFFFCLFVDMIVHSNSVFPFEGGESSGLTHLYNYIWEKNLVSTYKQTRNSLIGPENSTKFSAWFDNISFK